LQQELSGSLTAVEADRVMESACRLAATAQTLIAESYLHHYIKALTDATGFESALLDRLVQNEIGELLQAAGVKSN
jgi:hypothetical protein